MARFVDIMCVAIIDRVAQLCKKGHASKIVSLLLIRPINNDILSAGIELSRVGRAAQTLCGGFQPGHARPRTT